MLQRDRMQPREIARCFPYAWFHMECILLRASCCVTSSQLQSFVSKLYSAVCNLLMARNATWTAFNITDTQHAGFLKMPRRARRKEPPVPLYCCDCGYGYGSNHGALGENVIAHVFGKHGIDIKTGCLHFAHCNDCPRSNGHGRRLPSMQAVIDHLNDCHSSSSCEIYEFGKEEFWERFRDEAVEGFEGMWS